LSHAEEPCNRAQFSWLYWVPGEDLCTLEQSLQWPPTAPLSECWRRIAGAWFASFSAGVGGRAAVGGTEFCWHHGRNT